MGKRIKELREEKGLPKHQLADLLGTDKGELLTFWLAGQVN
ncbi:MAG TPA: hypothetical protein PK335_15640 [Draconibacterium sp.]|nr:hypothetical protein [Draconibacterium sp.]